GWSGCGSPGFAPGWFSFPRCASARFALARSASVRFAALRLAQARFASLRFASVRFAPARSGLRTSAFSSRHAFQAGHALLEQCDALVVRHGSTPIEAWSVPPRSCAVALLRLSLSLPQG